MKWSIAIGLSICLCVYVFLSGSISLVLLDWSSRNLLHRSSVAVAQFSSVSIVICCVLPVLWMMSQLAIMGRMVMRGRLHFYDTITSSVAWPGQSLLSMSALFLLICYWSIQMKNICASVSGCKRWEAANSTISRQADIPRFHNSAWLICMAVLAGLFHLGMHTFKCLIHCESKKLCHPNMTITLSVLDRFAKFFGCCKER